MATTSFFEYSMMPDADAGAVRFLTSALDGEAYRADVNLPSPELRVTSFRIEAGVLKTIANDVKLKEILQGVFRERTKKWEGKMDGLIEEPGLRKRVSELEENLVTAHKDKEDMNRQIADAAKKLKECSTAQQQDVDDLAAAETEKKRRDEATAEKKRRDEATAEKKRRDEATAEKRRQEAAETEKKRRDEEKEAKEAFSASLDVTSAAFDAQLTVPPPGWEKKMVGNVKVEADWPHWNAIDAFLTMAGSQRLAATVGRFYDLDAENLPEFETVTDLATVAAVATRYGKTWRTIFGARKERLPAQVGRGDTRMNLDSVLQIGAAGNTEDVLLGSAFDSFRVAFLQFIETGRMPDFSIKIRKLSPPKENDRQFSDILALLITGNLALERLSRDVDGLKPDEHFIALDIWWVVRALTQKKKSNAMIENPPSDLLAAVGAELDM